MRHSQRRYRRTASPKLRLGRDFTVALLLLVFGFSLPLATALTDQRVSAIRNQAISAAQDRQLDSGLSAGIAVQPVVVPIAPSADDTPPAEQGSHLPAATQPAQGLATLIPIVPTAVPVGPVLSAPAVPIEQRPPDGSIVSAPAMLMYHYVRTVDAAVDPLGYELSVTPELFDQQMAWLASNGYTGVRADLLVRCFQGELACPPKPIGITFDDGYADAYDSALPILQRYGFTATFYVVNSFIGQPAYMNLEQLAVLRDAGMEIGAHTIDHLMLTRLDLPEMSRQIAQSKQDLERALGVSVVSFCYPVGDYDATVAEQVRAAGFAFAVTTRWDNNYSDLLTLPRRRVAGGTSVESFGWIVAEGS